MNIKLKNVFKKILVAVLFSTTKNNLIYCNSLEQQEKRSANLSSTTLQSEKIQVLQKIKLVTGYRLLVKKGKFVTDPWINEDGVFKLLKRRGVLRAIFFELLLFYKAHRLKTAFYFVSRHGTKLSSPNYAHFLLEDLPILQVWLERYRNVKLVIRADSPKWVIEVLRLMGVNQEDYFGNSTPILVDDLLVLPKPFFSSHSYKKNYARFAMIEEIKTRVSKIRLEDRVEKPMTGSWIFIDRGSEARRKIENDLELRKILERFDFTILNPASYSFEEQVRIFSNCTLVLGQSGAGLVNGCFMRPKSILIELNHGRPDQGATCWESMCDEFNVEYRTIYPVNFVVNHDHDIVVDTKQLMIILSEIAKE